MLKKGQLAVRWLPVLAWMALIFAASGDRSSFQHSSGLIAPLLRWLLPHLSDAAVHTGVMIGRKCAHVAEYAFLATLLWCALRKPNPPATDSWDWSRAGLTVLLTTLYAMTDEVHQAFVPSRQGSGWDVLLDTGGAALAVLAWWGMAHWRRKRAHRVARPR